MSDVLTPIERRIYNYLVEYLKRETFQPSVREIGSRFGIRSTKTVTEHLQSLQRKGYLDRTPSRSRALKILGLNLSPDTYTIPVYRHGTPESVDEDSERLDLDRTLAGSADCFLVRASGDAREYGVLEGDLVLVEPCQQLENGDLAVWDREGMVEIRAARGPERLEELGHELGPPIGGGNARPRFLGVARGVLRTITRE